MADQQHSPEADDALQRELSTFFARTDPVPRHVFDAAHAAIEFRDLDGQLAELLRDSALEEKELAGVRGVGQRLISFAFGERFVEVDVAATGDRRDLSGYVVPAEPGTLRVQHASGQAVQAAVDDHGRFRLTGLARGPIRLWVESGSQPPFRTPWLTV